MTSTTLASCAAAALLSALLPLPAAHAQVFETSVTPDFLYQIDFGQSVGLQGDTLVVGTPGDNDDGSDSGSVQLFGAVGGGWTLQSELRALVPKAGAEFGEALALDGDVLLVGAWALSDGSWTQPGFHRGGAYVFRRTGATWSQEAFFQPAEVAANDHFGRAVAIDGDLAVVGAPYADPLGERSGRAWVFRRSGGTWTQEASLVAPDGGAEQRFGAQVAVAGDTLVVSAPIATGAAPRSGAAYAFTFTGGAWTLQQKLYAAGGAGEDRFGHALALDGERLAVGVPRRDAPAAANSGAIALFTRSGGAWTQEALLTAPAPRPLQGLGLALALQGDALVAGVLEDDEAAAKAGAGFVFRRTAGAWAPQAKLTSPLAQSGDYLGGAVALDGDLAALGTLWRTNTPQGFGAVDLFSGITGGAP